MAVGRAERRSERRACVENRFAVDAVEPALDLLELLEIGWHDCYGEITPSDQVIDDVLVVSGGTLAGLISAVRLALSDWRDLAVSAAERREAE